jgi:hypothetical protein
MYHKLQKLCCTYCKCYVAQNYKKYVTFPFPDGKITITVPLSLPCKSYVAQSVKLFLQNLQNFIAQTAKLF